MNLEKLSITNKLTVLLIVVVLTIIALSGSGCCTISKSDKIVDSTIGKCCSPVLHEDWPAQLGCLLTMNYPHNFYQNVR